MDVSNNLINSFRAGDPVAFKQVFDIYYNYLYSFARKMVDDRNDANDIVADTFVKLWELHPNFGTQSNLKAFLSITIKNACLDYIRFKQRTAKKYDEYAYLLKNDHELLRLDPFSESQKVRQEILTQVQAIIETLPDVQKQIFKLAFLQGLKPRQISELLGMTNQNVRNSLLIASNKIRRNMQFKDFFCVVLAYILGIL